MESSCRDIPAPGVGAECGPCPAGFTGNGIKCLGNIKCNVKCKVKACIIALTNLNLTVVA